MEKVMSAVRRVTQWGLWLGGAFILLAAVLIGIDILLREILVRSIGGANELAGYSLAIGTWGSHRRWSTACISASTRSTCCLRRSCAWLLDMVGARAVHLLLRARDLPRTGRCDAVLELRLAQPRRWNPDRHSAGGLVRRLRRFRRRRRSAAARHLLAFAATCGGMAKLIGARSVEEEVEEKSAICKERQAAREATTMLPVTLASSSASWRSPCRSRPASAGSACPLDHLLRSRCRHHRRGDLGYSNNFFLLVAVPFYVLMGEIMLRTGMAERMYAAIAQWVSWMPGGLMHTNVVGLRGLGRASGSSVATAVTIGTVAMGEIKKHNYNEPLFLGTIAAGGTLGILIPPSINMVVYGALTDTSIPKLYLAGFIPGFVLSVLFMATVLFACLWRPAWGGTPIVTSWEERIRTLPGLLPPLVILVAVIGSIYARLGDRDRSRRRSASWRRFAFAAWKRRLSWKVMGEIFEGTARTTGMIMAIVIGAYFLNVVITTIGLPNQIARPEALNLSPLGTLMIIIVFYIILGMFMETLSMMVATIPITTPIVIAAGYDPVWYGILVVLLMETALLTPPIGMNLLWCKASASAAI